MIDHLELAPRVPSIVLDFLLSLHFNFHLNVPLFQTSFIQQTNVSKIKLVEYEDPESVDQYLAGMTHRFSIEKLKSLLSIVGLKSRDAMSVSREVFSTLERAIIELVNRKNHIKAGESSEEASKLKKEENWEPKNDKLSLRNLKLDGFKLPDDLLEESSELTPRNEAIEEGTSNFFFQKQLSGSQGEQLYNGNCGAIGQKVRKTPTKLEIEGVQPGVIPHLKKEESIDTETSRSTSFRVFSVYRVAPLVSRDYFLGLIKESTKALGIHDKEQLTTHFEIANAIHEKKSPLIILLGGTSGTGKSSLSSLLSSRFGITSILSTDTVRHILRNFIDKKECPVLFASTYETGTTIDDPTIKSPVIYGYQKQCEIVQEKVQCVRAFLQGDNGRGL